MFSFFMLLKIQSYSFKNRSIQTANETNVHFYLIKLIHFLSQALKSIHNDTINRIQKNKDYHKIKNPLENKLTVIMRICNSLHWKSHSASSSNAISDNGKEALRECDAFIAVCVGEPVKFYICEKKRKNHHKKTHR